MPQKHSFDLGYKAAQTLYYAIGEQATRIGMPLNTSVTINFSSTDISPAKAVGVLQKILQGRFRGWATRPRKGAGPAFKPTWAYVFENRRDDQVFLEIGEGTPHNIHCHVLFHIPRTRRHDFERMMWEWLDSFCVSPCDASAIKIKTVMWVEATNRSYFLKGTAHRHAPGFGVSYKPQGVILGRRSNTSHNLGPAARKALDRLSGIRRKRKAA